MGKRDIDKFIYDLVDQVEEFGIRQNVDVTVVRDVKNCRCQQFDCEGHPTLHQTKIIIRTLFNPLAEDDVPIDN